MRTDKPRDPALARIARQVSTCRRCPRLARYLDQARLKFPDHRCKPVPAWGHERPRLLIVGLAPGLHGANRTGRMFTFDSSGRWLYGMLHEVGLASRPVSEGPGDGLRLDRVWITAAARCAPPGNRPLPSELAACRPYLEAELRHLTGAGRGAGARPARSRGGASGLRPAAGRFPVPPWRGAPPAGRPDLARFLPSEPPKHQHGAPHPADVAGHLRPCAAIDDRRWRRPAMTRAALD